MSKLGFKLCSQLLKILELVEEAIFAPVPTRFPLSYMYSTIKINSTLFFPLNFERDCWWLFS
jgi:hypothetical protein